MRVKTWCFWPNTVCLCRLHAMPKRMSPAMRWWYIVRIMDLVEVLRVTLDQSVPAMSRPKWRYLLLRDCTTYKSVGAGPPICIYIANRIIHRHVHCQEDLLFSGAPMTISLASPTSYPLPLPLHNRPCLHRQLPLHRLHLLQPLAHRLPLPQRLK